ncbi:Tex family protein [Gemmata sp. JC717]|uniref:helix-hairpin-helix domain-containing protein n=1 Tax=Gemmata algarum TaxID=2975278 RepID=UPI0021BA6184|nr:Tex family protein [Gemmata algarum]MDY3555428.1 Tex family protein [Gemmata algarum]
MTPSDPTSNASDSPTAPLPETPTATPGDAEAAPAASAEPVPPAGEAAAPEGAAPAVEGAADGAAGDAAPEEVAPPPSREPAQPVPEVPAAPQPHDLSRIAQDLQIRKAQVEAVVQLLDDDNTVPFITRYRKERTGGLNEDVIRRIQDRVAALRALTDRKRTILKSIAFQGKLNDDLVRAVLGAESPKRLEDLYLPFKPKKKSLATEAREKGLGPLAEAIFHRDPAVEKLDEVVQGLVDPDKWLLNTDDVMAGVRNILADMVADSADVRGPLRAFTWDTGVLVSVRNESVAEGKGKEYEPYFDFREPVKEIPPHRVLAINRGEKGNVLKVRVDTDPVRGLEITTYHLNLADHPHRGLLLEVAKDALERLLRPSLEREVRRELTDRAQEHAVMVFAKNLRSLLLQPPLRGKKVLAIDPGIRTGCKLAALDETGKLLEDAVIYPHNQKQAGDAKRKLEQLIRKYQISVIAIGNGTGCRDSEQLVADLIAEFVHRRLNPVPEAPQSVTVSSDAPAPAPVAAEAVPVPAEAAPAPAAVTLDSGAPTLPAESLTLSVSLTPDGAAPLAPVEAPAAVGETLTTGAPVTASVPVAPPPPPAAPPISLDGLPEAPADLAYVIVIEAGASDYSASPVAREEFPDLDATTRGTISIGRRLQDPLAELVKIDPQHIGVGLYQHDVKPKFLKESLEGVIESSVNQVGVDLNTASVPLLRHVSGLNQLVAREIVNYREKNGAFTSREQLLQVPGLGEKRFTQAAGFLKLPDGADPLDSTWIHPESYEVARKALADFGFAPDDLRNREKVQELRAKLNATDLPEMAAKLGAGEPTLDDIFASLARPGRDPREDLPPPIFKTGVLRLEDITQGMELKGTVLNVVPFGAFVDIGLKESGLVHISQMANRYIKSPYDVVSVGDVVTVWVMEVKPGEKKISLSMIQPGQERRQPDRGRGGRADAPPREPRGERPPRPQPAPQPAQEQRPAPREDRGGYRPPQRQGGFQSRQGAGAGQGQRYGNRGPGPNAAPPPQPQEAAPPEPPKKPGKPKPLPNLTPEKKAGKAALNTFGELLAFFKPPEPEKKPEPPKEEPKAEEPKPEEGGPA